jgi:hypothetical protein
MNIAIIEKGHFEVLYTLLKLFDKDGTRITIFIDDSSYKQMEFFLQKEMKKYQWIRQGNQPNRSFINSIFEHLKKTDYQLIYINTIADNFIKYAILLKKIYEKKVILTLHEIKGFFHYPKSLNMRHIIRSIGKKRLITIAPAFNVLSETLVPLLRQELKNEKTIFIIPGALFEQENFIAQEYLEGETVRIVIPGSIDTRRRNYDLVFEFLEKAKSANLNVRITLLGSFRKNYSEPIHKKCIHYPRLNNNLHFYETDIISQKEFDREMKEAHFIWMPLNQHAAVTDGVKEEYGISISTGNTGDVIRYAKPFFAPSYLPIDIALEKGCCRYTNTTEIINKLQQLNSLEYKRLQNEALGASLHYTKEKIMERNKSLFK